MTDMLLETPTPLLDDIAHDPEDCKHLVDQHKNECNVTEARVLGIEMVALCGYKWIPSKDPEPLPMCQACSKIMAAMP
jgi:hypothetical protein